MRHAAPPHIPGHEFVQSLGHGGYADVYLYEQERPARKVAVKVLRTAGMESTIQHKFTAEANAMASLAEHPNIVAVYAADVTADGRPYLTMQYYPRGHLGERAAAGPLPVAEALAIGVQIASAVETAHRAGLLHRDIKPANILVDSYGRPGLTDFGIATQVSAADDGADVGVSVPWSPPEILLSLAPASVASDVYSLAATVWHLLAGRSPFEVHDDNAPTAMISRIRDRQVPSTGRGDLPPAVERLLRAAMSKSPQARPKSAFDLARGFQAGQRQLSLPPTDLVVLAEVVQETDLPVGETIRRPPRQTVLRPQVVPAPPATGTTPPPPLPQQAVRTNRRATPAVPSAAPGAAPGSVPSVLPPAGRWREPELPPTELRPRDMAGERHTDSSDRAAATEPGRSGRTRVRAAVAVLLAVAAIVGFAVLRSLDGGGLPTTDATTPVVEPQDLGLPGDTSAPGAPAATWTTADGKVTFSLSYDNQLGSDTYLWTEVKGTKHTTDSPKLTVAAAASGETCVWVKVLRADGSNRIAGQGRKFCA